MHTVCHLTASSNSHPLVCVTYSSGSIIKFNCYQVTLSLLYQHKNKSQLNLCTNSKISAANARVAAATNLLTAKTIHVIIECQLRSWTRKIISITC